MKKSLLALAIATLVVASSAASATTVYDKDGTSLDVYGRVQGVVYSRNANGAGANANDNTIVASGRLGFDMRTQLTSGIAGFAKVEWDVADGQKNDSFAARYAWVGADFGQYGQIKVGTFEDAIKYVLNTTDIFDDWGCVGQAGNDDKRDAMVMYSWSGYGFDANISYQASQKDQAVDGAYYSNAYINSNNEILKERLAIEEAIAVSVGYTSPDVLFGPIAVRAGYGYANFSNHENSVGVGFAHNNLNTGKYDFYDQLALSASWGRLAQGPYVAALYQARSFSLYDVKKANGRSATDVGYVVTGLELVFGYSFNNGLSVRTGYEWQNVDFDRAVVKDAKSYNVSAYTIPIYVNYQINPNFNVWAEARLDAGTDSSDDASKSFLKSTDVNYEQNVYSIGARYTF